MISEGGPLARTICYLLLLFTAFLGTSVNAQPYTVKLGAVLPLSGDLAYVGNDIREGVTLALEERLASGSNQD